MLGRHERRLAAVERRLVWIVGSPRTGTTWLLRLLGGLTGGVTLDEPQIGTHLVLFSPDLLGATAVGFPRENLVYNDWRRGSGDYFFSDQYADSWRPGLRRLILERFLAQVVAEGRAEGDAPILVKEPNGSQAAALLGGLLPTSRLLAVWRDGRDVVDSELDASAKGAWLDVIGGGHDRDPLQRLVFLEDRALRWEARTEAVEAALAAHDPERGRAVTYEDLLTDTRGALTDLLAWLGAPTVADLDEVIAKESFAAIDPAQTGQGKFARAATPQLWRQSFTAQEQALLNRVLAAPLARLGYPPS